MILTLLLAACLPKGPALEPPGRQEIVSQFAVHSLHPGQQGRSLAGLAVVVFEGEQLSLQALTPAGTELFSLQADPTSSQLQLPDPAWAPYMDDLPFYRDLALVFAWSCPGGACQVAGGQLRERAKDGVIERRWRGPAGPVRARLEPGRAEILDRRRRYRLVLAGEAIHVP